MAETKDFQSLIAEAERAASGGDALGAALLLRRAATVQEAELGSWHPHLANTLNNLGVASESAGRPDVAEACYRRAVDIARRSLPPDDPLVTTSTRNLEEFCAQYQIPVERVPDEAPAPPVPALQEDVPRIGLASGAPVTSEPEPAMDANPSVPLPAAPPDVARPAADPPRLGLERNEEPARSAAAPSLDATPAESEHFQREGPRPRRRGLLLVIAAVVLLIVSLLSLLGRSWLSGQAGEETPGPPATRDPGPAAAAASARPETTPIAEAPAPVPTSKPAAATARPEGPREDATTSSRAVSAGLSVIDAQLCRDTRGGARGRTCAGDLPRPVRAGTLTYVTRVNATSATSVQHRWYRGATLHRTISLRVAPRRDGFQTYSRVSIGTPGPWRVAVTTRDGTVLQETTFEVR